METSARLFTALADRYRLERELGAGGGTTFMSGLPTTDYDVSADGRRFLLMRINGRTDDAEQLILVDGWLDEVRAKLEADLR